MSDVEDWDDCCILDDIESEIDDFLNPSYLPESSHINKNAIIEDKENRVKNNSGNIIKNNKNEEINADKININSSNKDIQINKKECINSNFCFEKDEKKNSNELPLNGANISFNKNDKLNNSIEHHKINNTFKQKNEIKNSEENKEGLKIINKNIIIQNNKIKEPNEIYKISYEDCQEKIDNNILNKNDQNSIKEDKDKIINEIILQKKDSNKKDINNNNKNDNNEEKLTKVNESKLLQNNENNINIINENKDNINIINKNKDNINIINENKDNNNIINENLININKNEQDIVKPNKKEEFKKTKIYERDELYVNLIHFDYNMTNKENYLYYNNFKVDVVGGYHAIDDLSILKNYLESLKKKDIPFIVVSSGSSAKDIIPICQKYSFIKEVIIFCKNYQYNEHYLKEYPGYVKQILISIKSVYKYIKTFGGDKFKEGVDKYINEEKYIFNSEEIQKNKQLKECPVITAIQYDRCGYLVHKIYSTFFGDINNQNEKPIFDIKNIKSIYDCLDKIDFEINEKNKLIQQFKDLFNLKDNNSFVEESIRAYTGESNFCYLFNRIMRNFEKGLISFAYYMGPLLYGLNKYVKENKKFAILKDKKLYRIIECSKLDFYLYKLSLGHIICFPSMTSTSSKEIKFKPSNLSKSININNDADEKVKIKMIFNYKYKKGNISPGIIIENNKGKDGRYLSKFYKTEKEVILFPFTFARIKDIKSKKEKGNRIQVIKLEIINRTSYIEYLLKTDDKKRILFSKFD